MKITHTIATLDLNAGGPSRSLPNLCIGLQRNGIEQQIVTYVSKNPNSSKLLNENIEITFVQKTSKFGLDYKKIIENVEGDVFHLHNLWNPILHWTIRSCRRRNIPYIISPRGTLEPWPLSQKKIKKRLSWLLYQKSDLLNASCIHATSETEARNIRKLGITTPIAIIPNGIDEANYPYLKTNENKIKTILFLSRVSPKKGIESLINTWISLPKQLKKGWRIRIVGEGDKGLNDSYYLTIKQLIDSHNLSNSIIMTGPKYGKDKIKEYKNANIFVLPTHSENFGMVIAEALISGVPVITTKGTPWKVLNDKRIGWWIDNTEDALRDSLIEAMSLSEKERRRKGLISRELIIEEFSMKKITSKYQMLYAWVHDKSIKEPDFFI